MDITYYRKKQTRSDKKTEVKLTEQMNEEHVIGKVTTHLLSGNERQ